MPISKTSSHLVVMCQQLLFDWCSRLHILCSLVRCVLRLHHDRYAITFRPDRGLHDWTFLKTRLEISYKLHTAVWAVAVYSALITYLMSVYRPSSLVNGASSLLIWLVLMAIEHLMSRVLNIRN